MSENNKKQSESKVNTEKKCFVIMPFSTPDGYPDKHFDSVYETIIKPAIEEAGFESDRVDVDCICDNIINKILKGLAESEMVVCDLSSRNPNVMYELGIRQAYGKKVVLIQDERTDRIFDVSGINTILYNSGRVYEDVLKSQKEITKAIKETYAADDISIMSIAKINCAPAEQELPSEKQTTELMLRTILNSIRQLEVKYDIINLSNRRNERVNISSEVNVIDEKYQFYRNKAQELLNDPDCTVVDLDAFLKQLNNFLGLIDMSNTSQLYKSRIKKSINIIRDQVKELLDNK